MGINGSVIFQFDVVARGRVVVSHMAQPFNFMDFIIGHIHRLRGATPPGGIQECHKHTIQASGGVALPQFPENLGSTRCS